MKYQGGLKENIKLSYTIERLCDNLSKFNNESILMNNYYSQLDSMFGDDPVALFDNSNITKIYGKKFECLDKVLYGSNLDNKVRPGYHVCEAVFLSKKEKQPIRLYSKIYSTKSSDFESENKYTIESIDNTIRVINKKFMGVFDRGYDNNQIINYMDKTNNYFVIRMNDKRMFLLKRKRKNCYE